MTRLNLLPPEIRNEIYTSKKNAKLRQYVYYSVMVSLAFVAIFAVVIFIVWTRKDEAVRQIELSTKQIESTQNDFDKATNLYTRLNLIKKIKKDSINWKIVLEEIGKTTPTGVQLDNLSYSKVDNRLKITGLSLSDTEAAIFKESLAKSEYFNYVDIESTGQAKDESEREVRSFTISLTLKADKLKK